ncbi:hypothetical protein LOK49_LG07G00170 [Camellia lanceoleosa]|uniref:Uncharacterized protein n=1 Tax=Camellia lanceoleosa TaxID=1840588 RepID=A0ACC0GXT1_9ERIC|nr:hypothetical protein LOK49_LG07G00170 [Camellia lanceoleosa]
MESPILALRCRLGKMAAVVAGSAAVQMPFRKSAVGEILPPMPRLAFPTVAPVVAMSLVLQTPCYGGVPRRRRRPSRESSQQRRRNSHCFRPTDRDLVERKRRCKRQCEFGEGKCFTAVKEER